MLVPWRDLEQIHHRRIRHVLRGHKQLAERRQLRRELTGYQFRLAACLARTLRLLSGNGDSFLRAHRARLKLGKLECEASNKLLKLCKFRSFRRPGRDVS